MNFSRKGGAMRDAKLYRCMRAALQRAPPVPHVKNRGVRKPDARSTIHVRVAPVGPLVAGGANEKIASLAESILGIRPSVVDAGLGRRLLLASHPDKGGSAERFMEVKAALNANKK